MSGVQALGDGPSGQRLGLWWYASKGDTGSQPYSFYLFICLSVLFSPSFLPSYHAKLCSANQLIVPTSHGLKPLKPQPNNPFFQLLNFKYLSQLRNMSDTQRTHMTNRQWWGMNSIKRSLCGRRRMHATGEWLVSVSFHATVEVGILRAVLRQVYFLCGVITQWINDISHWQFSALGNYSSTF